MNSYYLLAIVKQARVFTVHSQRSPKDYISFTRANFSPLIKSWCDWCSIGNGYASFFIDAINEYYTHNSLDSIKQSNLAKLKFLIAHLGYLKIMLVKDEVSLAQPEASAADLFPIFYKHAPVYLKELLDNIAKIFNLFQAIEHQWCPFRHMKRIAHIAHSEKARYANYLTCEEFNDIVKAGEIIFNFKHLKCNQCVELINKSLEENSSASYQKAHRRAENFLELICKLSC